MNTALLIIDVQQSLIDEGIWNADKVLVQLNYLIATAKQQNAPIVLIRDTRIKPDGSFHQTLDCGKDDIVIEKNYCDSFMETNLNEFLISRNIKQLVIGGMQSDFCVDTTCRQAATLGYKVVLVSDAHSTLDHEHLKAEQIVAHHNRILRSFNTAQGQIRVRKSAEISFE